MPTINRLKPVTDTDPMKAFAEIHETAIPPYRIIIAPGVDDWQTWLDAARITWPKSSLEQIYDDSRNMYLMVLKVPQVQ